MRRSQLTLTIGLLIAMMGIATGQESPYVGQQGRAIKAVSAEEERAYLAGEGMGFAKAAELNHYPGPKHVLAMKAELQLTPQQVSAAEEIFRRMRVEAVDLGAQLVAKERKLDELFSQSEARGETVSALTAEIGVLLGRLRMAHLQAHLETRAILSQEQVEAYNRLRGYGAGEHQHNPERHKQEPN